MAGLIYGLCALAAALCSGLLLRAYRRNRYRLLFWGGLCFAGITLNHVLLIADNLLLPSAELYTLRLATALGSMMILLYGCIWDTD